MNYKDIKLIPITDSIEFIEMSDEEYFSAKYSDYISNSKLALINPLQDGSPETFLEGLSKHQKFSDSLVFGSAVHELVLQPESFEVAEGINRPTAKMGAMADELYKVYSKHKSVYAEDVLDASETVNYYKGKMNNEKVVNVLDKCKQYWKDRSTWESKPLDKEPIYLDEKSRCKLASCLDSVEKNKDIQSLLHPEGILETPISCNEAALFINVKAQYEDKEVLLKLKGKLDNFTVDLEGNNIVLNDLKTTGHYIPQFKESFEKYRYFRQMAMYLWMLQLYVKKEYKIEDINSMKANMLLVSTIPEYKTGVYKVSLYDINRGFEEFSDLLKRVAEIYLK